jgi:hypothetical protein
MDNPSKIHTLIDQLTEATYGDLGDEGREKHTFKEAVLGLVRLVQAEQTLDARTTLASLMAAQRNDLHSYSEVD